jgi:hypothetical protein
MYGFRIMEPLEITWFCAYSNKEIIGQINK